MERSNCMFPVAADREHLYHACQRGNVRTRFKFWKRYIQRTRQQMIQSDGTKYVTRIYAFIVAHKRCDGQINKRQTQLFYFYTCARIYSETNKQTTQQTKKQKKKRINTTAQNAIISTK